MSRTPTLVYSPQFLLAPRNIYNRFMSTRVLVNNDKEAHAHLLRKALYLSDQPSQLPVMLLHVPKVRKSEGSGLNDPSQRAPLPRPLSHFAQSVGALDHSPMMVHRFDDANVESVFTCVQANYKMWTSVRKQCKETEADLDMLIPCSC